MIKNVKLKLLLQNLLSIVSFLNKRISHNKSIILLYSNSGLRDNIEALYNYLIENNFNERYKIICSTSDYKEYKDKIITNVSFVSNKKGFIHYLSAGFVFYCFGKIPIMPGKNQMVLQMWHGAPFKAPDEGMLKGHSWSRQYYTNALSTSANFIPFWSKAFSMPERNIIVCGQPRCDILYKESPNYQFGTYKKLILWAPTFRKSHITGYSDVKDDGRLVPVIQPNEYDIINKELKKIGVKIVVKLHPMQDLDGYNFTDLDYFILMSHREFVDRKMDLYRLMVQCDALITDYSSVFYDFLLLNRPIGFTEDDLEDYSNTRGFAVDDPEAYRPGMRIKTKEDLIVFAENLVLGKDDYKEDRKRVLALSNDYQDGKFSKRLLEILGIK